MGHSSSGTTRGSDGPASLRLLLFLVLLLLGALPGGDLRAEGVADLVAGSDRRDFFPHSVLLLLEEMAEVFVDLGDDFFGADWIVYALMICCSSFL